MAAEDVDIFEEQESIEMTGTPGVDQVFTQIITSPDFRSMVRVEDVPPETLKESRQIFDYMLKRGTLDDAISYLVKFLKTVQDKSFIQEEKAMVI